MALSDETTEELLSACRTTVGDELRSITYFTPDEYDHLYLREDLERGDDPEAFVENERQGFSSQRTYEWSELGEYEYTIRVFTAGHLVRVITDDEGVYVTTGDLTMDRFGALVEAIQSILNEE
ncbi:DUF7522 family protein [Halalkalicoccus ordinarius]|uniref:DUF7522 family protein n=1 Tax=Halalkalicoccus ordinarius TaxID=3116651 RepID=UPI00300F45D5